MWLTDRFDNQIYTVPHAYELKDKFSVFIKRQFILSKNSILKGNSNNVSLLYKTKSYRDIFQWRDTEWLTIHKYI